MAASYVILILIALLGGPLLVSVNTASDVTFALCENEFQNLEAMREKPNDYTGQVYNQRFMYLCLHKPDFGVTWMEGIEICRQFNGSLLYVYSIEELRDILAIHIAELKTKINPDIEKITEESRTIYLAATDRETEGEVWTQLNWLADDRFTFSYPLNLTDENGAAYRVKQILQSQKKQILQAVWDPKPGGAGIIPLDGNAADRDCVAVIIKSETEIAFMWIDCDEIKAKQVICRREGNFIGTSEVTPCSLSVMEISADFNDNVEMVAVVFMEREDNSIYRALAVTPQLLYAQYMSEAQEDWLNSAKMSAFILPQTGISWFQERDPVVPVDVYLLSICSPGWFTSEQMESNIRWISCSRLRTHHWDRQRCAYYDECKANLTHSYYKGVNTDRCSSHGYCIPRQQGTTGHTDCICLDGWTGENCEIEMLGPCNKSQNPCGGGHTCVNQQMDYYCVCNGKLTETNQHCDDYEINECSDYPCKNNATCHDQQNGYRCECSGGSLVGSNTSEPITYPNGTAAIWQGRQCDIDPIDACDDNPCKGGIQSDNPGSPRGLCLDLVDGYKCACDQLYSGPNCENIDEEELSSTITGTKLVLVVVYTFLLLAFYLNCMLLTALRRREITNGKYKTAETIINEYEEVRGRERAMLMEYVEDAGLNAKHTSNLKTKMVGHVTGLKAKVRRWRAVSRRTAGDLYTRVKSSLSTGKRLPSATTISNTVPGGAESARSPKGGAAALESAPTAVSDIDKAVPLTSIKNKKKDKLGKRRII